MIINILFSFKNKLIGAMLVTVLATACIALISCSIAESTATNIPLKPGINYFTADSVTIKQGESINLNWDIINADSISIDPGIGKVQSAGTYRVTPSSDVKYILTAVNANGETSSSISIRVSPALESPDCMSVSCDPVTGRNADISFQWEQLCLCNEYELQIAKDPKFTLLVYNRQQYAPYSVTSPGFVYLAGGILECGHTYYMRIRCTSVATGQRLRSPWSIMGCLIVNSGLPIGGANK